MKKAAHSPAWPNSGRGMGWKLRPPTAMQLLWPGPEITRDEDGNERELGVSLWCIFGRWPLSFHLSTSGLIQPVLVTLTAQQ